MLLRREWSGMKTRGLGEKLHRDLSLMSRLYRRYAEKRGTKIEEAPIYVLKR